MKGFGLLRNFNSNYPWAKTGKRKSEEIWTIWFYHGRNWVVFPWWSIKWSTGHMRQYVQAGKVPFQHVNPVQKQSDWVCNCDQATSRPKLVVCHWAGVNALPSRVMSTQGCHVRRLLGHLCTYCTDTSVSTVFWEEWQSHCTLDGVGLLENQLIFFLFSFPMLSQTRCQHLPLFIAGWVRVTVDVEVFSACSTK